MFKRFSSAAIAVSLLFSLTAGCSGGSEDATDEAESVRTLEPGDAGTDVDTEDIAAEFSVDANEAVAEANAIDGDTNGDGVLSEAETSELLNAALLDFSQCVRDEGVEDFEDVTFEMFGADAGPGDLLQVLVDRGVNPVSDEGGAIMGTCAPILATVAANAPQRSDETQADAERTAVEWAACLREKGIEDFPDPDFSESPIGYGMEIGQQFEFDMPPMSDAIATCAAEGKSLLGIE